MDSIKPKAVLMGSMGLGRVSDWRYVRSRASMGDSRVGGNLNMGQNTATRIGRKGEDTMTSLNFRTINKTGPRVSRSMKILDSMVGQVIQVHNGRSWRSVRINSERVGFRAGEFVATTAWYKQEVSRTRGVGGMAARGNKAPAAPRKAKRL